jgi:hypothetical protein
MGGSARIASTPTIGPVPVLSRVTTRTSRPRLGIARAALLKPMPTKRPRPVCPIRIPNGMPITAATSTDRAVYARC